MSQPLTVELSNAAYAALQAQARAAARTPAEVAAAALEQRVGVLAGTSEPAKPTTEAEKQGARARFERHFGAVNLGHPTGADNEAIDADLAAAYGDNHE